MKNYKNILIAVELIKKNDNLLIDHIDFLNKGHKYNIILVHAIEHLVDFTAYGVGGVEEEIEQRAIDSSMIEMSHLGKKLGVPDDLRIVKVGPAKPVILGEAKKHKADLIIIGSHGKGGIKLVLGSTANAVLHEAKCDVLAVRLLD